jgi:hypothetical protein
MKSPRASQRRLEQHPALLESGAYYGENNMPLNPNTKKMIEAAALKVDDVSSKLSDQAHIIRQQTAFYPNQIVTARPDFGYQGAGIPHIVVKLLRLERNRTGFGTAQYGKQADMQVAVMSQDGTIQTYWVESFAFERWNDLTHGVPYNEGAAKAAAALADYRAAEAGTAIAGTAEDETVVVAAAPAVLTEAVTAEPATVIAEPAALPSTAAADVSSAAPIPAEPSPTPALVDTPVPVVETIAVVTDPAGPGTPLTEVVSAPAL